MHIAFSYGLELLFHLFSLVHHITWAHSHIACFARFENILSVEYKTVKDTSSANGRVRLKQVFLLLRIIHQGRRR
jgi:hypothetical protein